MNRLWWWCGGVLVVAVAVAGSLAVTGFPGRSDFLARQQPGACQLISGGPPGTTVQSTPYGAITSCLVLGRRTNLFADPDGAVFVLAETDQGVVALRIDYRGTGPAFTADAVEIPQVEAPGISGDTANRIKDAVNQRGGLHAARWRVHPAQG